MPTDATTFRPRTAPPGPRIPAPRTWPTIVTFAVAWVLLALGARSTLFRDPGTFWHVLAGEQVLTAGFPREDWLTFTFLGKPWIAHQWLGEVGMAVLHRAGGLDALLLATSAALALLFAFLFHGLCAAGLRAPWAALVVVVTFLASSLHFHVRPHVLSILLFAWLCARLEAYDAGRASLRSLVPLWPMFLIWVNVHGAALGGLATLGLAGLGWSATWVAARRGPIRSAGELAGLWAVVLACGVTILVNPYGLATPRVWGAILDSPYIRTSIEEHASLVRTRSWQVLPLVALYLAALIGSVPPLRVPELLPMVWLVLTFDRIRNAPLFAVAAVTAFGSLLPRIRWIPREWRRTKETTSSAGSGSLARFPRWLLLAPAVAIAVLALFPGAKGRGESRFARLDPRRWPVGVLDALRSTASEMPEGSPILNDRLFGGFVSYHVPRLRTFVDDRLELYGDEFLQAEARADPALLDHWVSSSGILLALALPGSRLQAYLEASPGWRRIAASEGGVLYRREVPAAPR